MRIRSVAALAMVVLLAYAGGLLVFYSMSVRTDDEGRPALRGRAHFAPAAAKKAPLLAPLFLDDAGDKAALRATTTPVAPLRKAFATVLCDDNDTLPAVVLLMSLLRSGTDAQLVPLLTPRVARSTEQVLRMMAPSRVKPQRISDVTWPGYAQERACRYARFRAWGLVNFDRVIYVDADSMIVAPLDSLFTTDRLSALPGPFPKSISSSLLVLKPSNAMLNRLMKRADAHFDDVDAARVLADHLEERPRDARFAGDTDGWHSLDAKYALAPAMLSDERGASLVAGLERRWELEAKDPRMGAPPKDGLANVHFGGGAKPWRVAAFSFFKEAYAPALWLRWWRSADEAAAHLGCVGYRATLPSRGYQCGLALCQNHTLAKCRPQTCEAVQAHFATKSYNRITHRLTVVLNTRDGSKIPLEELVAHYANATVVQRIVIVWHAPTPPPPFPAPRRVVLGVRGDDIAVTTLWRPLAAPSRRYALFEAPTAHVLICDDDVLVSASSLNALLAAAREGSGLASPLVRSHEGSSTALDGGEDATFSLTSGRLQVVPSWLLFAYRCLLPPAVHAYVESIQGCADVAFQLVAARAGLGPPIFVDVPVADYAIQGARNHVNQERCPRELAALLGMRVADLPTASLKTGRILTKPDALLLPRSVLTDFPPQLKKARSSFTLKRTPYFVPVLEDGAVDQAYPDEPAFNRLNVRSWARAPNEARSERFLYQFMLRPQLPYDKFVQKARVAALAAATASEAGTIAAAAFSADDDAETLAPRETNYLRAVAAVFLKVRRKDLEKVATDELALLQPELDGPACPLRVYYCPKLDGRWRPQGLTFASLKAATKKSRKGSQPYFVPLGMAGPLVVVNLRVVDDAYGRYVASKGRADTSIPSNVTLALFYDDVDALNETAPRRAGACGFKSSRAPGAARPRFRAVAGGYG